MTYMQYQHPESADELLQCFDESGKAISTHSRAEVHQNPLRYWHGVANIWLVNNKGQILSSRRANFLSGNPGKWQTYFGGHVKSGATFEESAVREIEEEIGLKINSKDLHLIDQGKNDEWKHLYKSYAMLFDKPLDILRFKDGEITEVKWLDFDKYNDLRKIENDKWCNGCNPDNQRKIKQLVG